MAYNHRYEYYKWEHWKIREEKQLLELGMTEEMILELRNYDKEMFNKERVYYFWNRYSEEMLEHKTSFREPSFENIHQLLDQLDNQALYHALCKLDQVTLQIIFYRVQKYSYAEIGQLTGMKISTISTKLSRLRKKLKKFLK